VEWGGLFIFITFAESMTNAKLFKCYLLLSIISMMILHSVLPHLHHSHQIAEEITVEEITVEEIDDHLHDGHHHHHHHHDNEKQSEEEESNFLLKLLLESHAHDTEVGDDFQIIINYNKILVGKNLPIITLLSKLLIPPDIGVVSEKKNVQHKQGFRKEHLVLNCPLRAPPTLG
jgi:hypothetical protein